MTLYEQIPNMYSVGRNKKYRPGGTDLIGSKCMESLSIYRRMISILANREVFYDK